MSEQHSLTADRLDLYLELIESGHDIPPDTGLISKCIEGFSEMTSLERALFIKYHEWALSKADTSTWSGQPEISSMGRRGRGGADIPTSASA